MAIARHVQAISTKNIQRDFVSGMSSLEGKTRKPTLEEQKKHVKAFKKFVEAHKRRIFGHGGKQDFEQHRKEIEEQIDNGATFSHLSRQYPMKREWAK